VTKLTPVEEYKTLRERVADQMKAAHKRVHDDAEKTARALSDPDLSFDERLEIFKSLQAWPRIVLGLYEAELAIAQKDRKEKGRPKYGGEEPSEIAPRVVGETIGLGPDRVRDLCRKGRTHLKQGMPPKAGQMTVAMFRQMFSTVVPEEEAAEFKKVFLGKERSLFPAFRKGCEPGRRFFDLVTSLYRGLHLTLGVVFFSKTDTP
jgi:hypothetical protein